MAPPSMFEFPLEVLRFVSTLRRNGHKRQAAQLGLKILEAEPDDPESRAAAQAILGSGVPNYHRSMLADEQRNEAYQSAINRAAPGKRVLDIGTGSGLLAMIAARAGADQVYACEANPVMADIARRIIDRNGLSDRITLIDKRSTELDRETDLDGGVDLVISEVFSEDIVGEMVVETLAHAQRELILPGAEFLPAKVSLMGALAEHQGKVPVTDACGFDLSLMNDCLSDSTALAASQAGSLRRSEPMEILKIRFDADSPIKPEQSETVRIASDGGRANGLLTWMRIDFGDGVTYENPPGGDEKAHWLVRFTPLFETRETTAGEVFEVGCSYSAGHLLLWNAHPAN